MVRIEYFINGSYYGADEIRGRKVTTEELEAMAAIEREIVPEITEVVFLSE